MDNINYLPTESEDAPSYFADIDNQQPSQVYRSDVS